MAAHTPKPTAQAYIQQHQLHAALDAVVQPIVRRRDPRPLEALARLAPAVAAGTPASAMALISAGNVTQSELASLDFDAFPLYNRHTGSASASAATATASSSGALHALCQKIFEAHGLLSHFGVDAPSFLQWVATVEANYHAENPFHNFLHAFNVLQTTNVFATAIQKETGNAIGKLELFALFVAALCHDLQHPGVTNQFLIATDDPLALRYGDRAVLEGHHCAATLSLFFGPAADAHSSILKRMPQPAVAAFRRLLVELIMATDLSQHSAVTARLNDLAARVGLFEREKAKRILLGPIPASSSPGASGSVSGGDGAETADGKRTLLAAILKAADLSNEARSFAFSERWAPLVKEEFFRQGDVQRRLGHIAGRELTAACDREDPRAAVCYDQPQFIEALCVPLYSALERISPAAFGAAAGNLKANSVRWRQLQPEGARGTPTSATASSGTPSSHAANSASGGFPSPTAAARVGGAMVPPEETEDSEEYDDDDEL